MVYEYEIDGSVKPGTFTLPNTLVVDNKSMVLAYNYDKEGRTQSVQLVGQFSFNNFELSLAIERKNAAEGNSTTLRFAADVRGKSAEGTLVFALKRKDSGAITQTTLAVSGPFTARFNSGVLTVGLALSQRTINGTPASRELMFNGKLVHKAGTEFAWELKMSAGTTNLSILANQIKLGKATGNIATTVKMKGGEVQAVRAMFGVSL